MKTVIFDLDGTLADTSPDLIRAANATFRDLGLGDLLEQGRDASTAMKGGRRMLELGFERAGLSDLAAKVDENYPKILAHYSDCLSQNTRFFEGATDAVERLRDAGYRTGICTNKPVDLATRLIEELDASHLFDSLIGANSLSVRKPDPAPYVLSVSSAGGTLENSVLIGDTITDRKTADAAGVNCVLVTFGPDGHAVADLEPDGLLHSYDDLEAVLAPLFLN